MDESAYSTLLKYVENTEYTENLRQYDTFVALAIGYFIKPLTNIFDFNQQTNELRIKKYIHT
jgi:hypothetical protein